MFYNDMKINLNSRSYDGHQVWANIEGMNESISRVQQESGRSADTEQEGFQSKIIVQKNSRWSFSFKRALGLFRHAA